MEMGEHEVLPVVQEVPVIAGVNGTDPTRRMSNFLKQVRDLGFDGINNFPTVGVIDGKFRTTREIGTRTKSNILFLLTINN